MASLAVLKKDRCNLNNKLRKPMQKTNHQPLCSANHFHGNNYLSQSELTPLLRWWRTQKEARDMMKSEDGGALVNYSAVFEEATLVRGNVENIY